MVRQGTMNERTQLTESQIDDSVHQHPELPSDYLEYLHTEGWGKVVNVSRRHSADKTIN